ncbi:UbiD family decarboxylase [Methanomicrobium antiquum]|uniref:Anhydromevalonate phosphate decarboxylase n=1 Tax=Methanomicrobium antiquum TaxID=487686 RepID=A0AAF0FS18_9EURY|nr:UbiD family decarboxylase [Methanomicrobium antiquum]MDD3977480.1 UbiD family decarboxylase [Methanomicrobium sp.]WFN37532.1 UbiD family decarboxylase [Methanomicrobium antiquum]
MREFIKKMRDAGLVDDIYEEVSSVYQAPKIASKTNKLVFFHKLDGDKKSVMNVTSIRKSLSIALGYPEEDIVKNLSKAEYNGNVVNRGKLYMIQPDLLSLPIMKHYPKDAGRYLTSAIVFSEYGNISNASIHRMLVLDKNHLAARLVEGRHTHNLLKSALSNNEKLPVAITIGTHPLVTFASCTRVPEGKEMPFAAELMGGEISVFECPNGVKVPDAEIVLEGYITGEKATEGPFVDITGTYDPVRQGPVIEITGMHIKDDPIYHGILPGGNEHKLLMGMPYEPKIYRYVSGVTTVRNVSLTTGGCGYLHGVVQIRKNTQGDAKNAIMAAFAAHTSLKHVVVVDEDIDIYNMEDVEYAIATRVRGDEDIMVIKGVRGSSLDPCRIGDGMNVKVGVDATMVMGKEDEFIRAEWDD